MNGSTMFKWFCDNHMKVNTIKDNLPVNKKDDAIIRTGDKIENS